jgi:hypothetical protein
VTSDDDSALLYTDTFDIFPFQSAMNSSTLPSIMGGLVTTGGGFIDGDWNGKISNVSVYNKALSSSEVTQNYNALKSRFT